MTADATGPTLIQTAVISLGTATHRPDPTPTLPSEGPTPTSSGSGRPETNVAAITGGAVGGCAILAIFVLCLVWLLRCNKKNKLAAGTGGDAYVGMQYEWGRRNSVASCPLRRRRRCSSSSTTTWPPTTPALPASTLATP